MSNRQIVRLYLLVFGMLLGILVTTADLAAQTSLGTSSVGGEVRDASGSVIQDAKVELADLEHNVSRVTRTNGTGNYLIPGVPAGFYSLTFSKDGFKEFIVSNFKIIIDQSVTVYGTLDVGTISQSVQVTENSEALLLDTVSNVFGTVLDSARVENLPLNGRNFMQLGFMAAGTAVPTSNADLAVAQYGHQDRAIMIGGNGEGLSSYMVDGIETRGARIGESGLNLSLADIEEFKVNVSFFMADQGPDPGIINLYTKSGSNQVHGQVFEYVRNGDFNARNFFAPKPEPLHRNQFGFDLGGPIAIPHVINGRDKLWFHAYYEGQRQVEALSQNAFTPDAKMFGGDLSEIPQQIYNPFSVDPTTGLRQPFPNNQIPAAMINPVAHKLLTYYLPGFSYAQTPSNLFVNPSDKLTDNQFGGRVDAALSSRQNLFVNFIWQSSPALNDGIMPYTGAEYPADAQLAVVQHTFTFNPGLINVARIGFSRDFAFHRGQPSTSGTLAEQLGIDNTFDPSGIPLMAIQGFSSFGTTVGKIGNVDDNYQADESLNYIHGKHAFAFG